MNVRPLVEYNSIIWSPHLKQDIEAVESVQRRFTRILPGFKKFSYAERFKRLNLPSLELRRLHCDLLWCYKIMFGHVDINFDMFELRMSTNTTGTSTNYLNSALQVAFVHLSTLKEL